MKKLIGIFALVAAALLGQTAPARADTAVVVSGCGTPPSTYGAGQTKAQTQDTTGKECVNATVSASITFPTIGAAVPATADYIAGNKGGLLAGVLLDGSGFLEVNCATGCNGGTFNNNADAVATSATNGQSAVWNYLYNGTTFDRMREAVTGVNSVGTGIVASQILGQCLGTPSALTDTRFGNLAMNCTDHSLIVSGGLAQEATTAGSLGSGVMGSVTTAAPTYTTAKMDFLSLTTGGLLRGEANQATAANLNATVTQGPSAALGAGWAIKGDEIADTTGTFTNGTQTNSVTATNLDGYDTALITINGTFGTATATFEASDDTGTTFYPVQGARSDGTASELGYTTLTNTNRAWIIPINGFDQLRVHSSAVASGTVNVRISIMSQSTAAAAINSLGGFGAGVDTNSGNLSANTLRMTFATNQVSNTNPFLVNGAVTPADAKALGTTSLGTYSYTGIYNGTTIDLLREAVNSLNSTGTGIPSAQLVGQCDDTSPTAITENSFGNARIDCATHAQLVTIAPSATAGGTTLFTLTLANTTNATNVKATPGQLYSISGFNMSSATPVWISLYNNAGTPTCGTSIIQQFLIPGNTTGAGFVYDFSSPKGFAAGIAFCATTGIAGTGAPAATTYTLNIDYK